MTQERYSQDDLASMFGRTTRTIYIWRQRGIVPPPQRIFREPYWTPEQVESIKLKFCEVYGSSLKSAEVDAETK